MWFIGVTPFLSPLLEKILPTHPWFGINQSRVTQRTRKSSKTSEALIRDSRCVTNAQTSATGPSFLSRGIKLAV